MSTVQQIPTTQSGFDCQILEEKNLTLSLFLQIILVVKEGGCLHKSRQYANLFSCSSSSSSQVLLLLPSSFPSPLESLEFP